MFEMLDSVYHLFVHYATWRTVALLLLAALFLVGSLNQVSQALGNHKVLDVRIWYSAEDARQFLEAIGERGRRIYVLSELTLDLAFPLVYGTLFAILVVHLYSLELGRTLILMPLLTAVVDILENLTVAHLAWWFKGQASALTPLAATFTAVKWLAFGSSLLVLFVGAVQP